MPYKDKEQRTEASRLSMQKKRQGLTQGLTLDNGVYIDKEKAIKLMKIHSSLDKRIAGLSGTDNMLDLVRYGDFTMREVGVILTTGEVS
ncbi:hypothetical protein LCGC14_1253230 [marine sediment metagenome]|uniref:Uncharacterized protein n=1 Tax=marine sediment metagenome TaxID=412755 RepID=A0A0F9L2P0_9ZZZZ